MSPDRRFKEILSTIREDNKAIPRAADIWEAFKVYGREIFNSKGVGLLFQVGRSSDSLGGGFYFEPVCQFEVPDDDGEYEHFEQLHCEMTSTYSSDLEGIKSELWSFDFSTADAFFHAAESTPGFGLVMKQEYQKIDIYYEEV